MKITSFASLLILIAVTALQGCRKDSATPPPLTPSPSTRGPASVRTPTASNVVVRIRKLGGADGKQLLNQIAVTTPLNEDFTVTEQVGTTQLELRGRVLDLKDGMYRVSYDYAETSASGRQELKSLIELTANSEKQVGGLRGQDGETMETVVLSLSRP